LKFKEIGIENPVLEGVEAMGFEEATPIQEQAIPEILNNKDLIACAQTGTGKTAAFLLPVMQKIHKEGNNGKISTVIISPTRELAVQIDNQIQGLGYFLSISSIAVYGGGDGSSWDTQKRALVDGADIVVATPGRLIAHMQQEYVDFSHVKHFILDEADRMLDMGFYDDIKLIMEKMPKERQNLMFSATMPSKIRKLAKEVLVNPIEISIAISKPAENIVQAAFLAHDGQKAELLKHLLSAKPLKSVIVFTSRKSSVDQLTREFKKMGIKAEAIHSGLEQAKREEVLREFINRNVNVMVATDVLSRGIDIEGIDMVVNYNVPQDAEDYVHRIGRTARASADGIAFTFINAEEGYLFRKIEALIEREVRKVKLPAHLGEGPEYTTNKPFDKRRNGGFQGKRKPRK
jgi:ATP-dependent RNA helicase RhlE